MARFDVYKLGTTEDYLLDVQTDLLSGLNTRVVVPLMLPTNAPKPATRLNPILKVENSNVIMVTQFLAAIPQQELEGVITNLSHSQNEISSALDMVFFGF